MPEKRKSSSSEEDLLTEDTSSSRQNEQKYVEGEDVYLVDQEKILFKATFSNCKLGDTVHHKPITKTSGRFIIQNVLNASVL